MRFIGSNLAAEVLKRGEELFVLDNLFRYGSGSNLEWLRTKGDFTYYPYDTRNTNDVETVIKEVQPGLYFSFGGSGCDDHLHLQSPVGLRNKRFGDIQFTGCCP